MQTKNIGSIILLIFSLPSLCDVYGQNCPALSVTLSSTGIEADISISDEDNTLYTWYVNGNSVASGMDMYLYNGSLVNGDKIKCKVTYMGTSMCVTGSPAMSDEVTISNSTTSTVQPTLSIEITSGAVFCTGDEVYFEAVTTGSFVNFKWRLNGILVGTNSPNFSTKQFTQGSVVSVTADVVNPCQSCVSSIMATTESIPITIIDPPVVTINSTGTRIICSACVVTITLSPTTTGNLYGWYKDDNIITGENRSYYVATSNGTYRASVIKPGCSSDRKSDPLVIIKNTPPVANAGENQIINQTITSLINSITLYGSGSDAESSVLTYSWSKIAGSTAILSGSNTPTLQITGLSAGNYTFRLTVSDGIESSKDDVDVTVNAPINNYNYIQEVTALIGKETMDEVGSLDIAAGEKSEVNTYYDGLGRPMQVITTQGSPQSKKDVIQPIMYDKVGREAKKYLPYVSGNDGFYKVNALAGTDGSYTSGSQYQFYQQNNGLIASDVSPFAMTVFEASPLNRVVKQGSPGSVWQPDSDNTYNSVDYTVKRSYETNSEGEVILFNYDASTGLINTDNGISYYGANQLQSNKTKDEHNNEVIEYIDIEGHTVCKKVQYGTDASSNKVYACTYYVYDDFGNLVVVLPPEAVNSALNALSGQ